MENILVCSYNEFDNLAHKVRGNKALQPLNFIENDLLQENNINCVNPVFFKRDKYAYICCESIYDGTILTIDTETKEILKSVSSCGKSSCYLLLDPEEKFIIINYWDSTITVHFF